jgi:hypothetical protein
MSARHGGTWHPVGAGLYSELDRTVPEAGSLLANDRKLWRVIAVHEHHRVNWKPGDESRLADDLRARARTLQDMARGKDSLLRHFRHLVDWDARPETWPGRPRTLVIQPASGGKQLHARWPQAAWMTWHRTDEHHAVCASCGELYPCREVEAAKVATREMADVERLMSVPPGACWNCHEPITARQKAIEFPGENLLLPGAAAPAFHARASGGCYDAAYHYRQRWLAANPDVASPTSLFDHLDPP